MDIVGAVKNFCSSIGEAKPIQSVVSVAKTILDKVTGGRGLKVWSSPKLRELKSHNNFHEFRLDNGMKVLVKQAEGTQVDMKLVFNTGSAKDPKGKEGLAHLLEHLVFEHNKGFKDKIDGVVNLQGGYVNASTDHRQTFYKNILPKDKFELGLRILASIMNGIDMQEEMLEKEKATVCTEIVKTESIPFRKVLLKFQEALYGKDHPLSGTVIGDKESVQSITMDDVYNFYKNEYVPNNATLVISGDVDIAQLKSMLKRHFANAEPNSQCTEIDLAANTKPSEIKDHTLKDDSLMSLAQYAYSVPRFNHRDSLLCGLVNIALTGGEDSRLYRKLVDGEANDGKKAVLEVEGMQVADKFHGHYHIVAKPLDDNLDTNFEIINRVLDEELQDIAANGLTEKEFKRVIDAFEAVEVYQDDQQHSRIDSVYHYSNEGDDWIKSLRRLEDLKSITNDDIKHFVKQYLNNNNRHSLKVMGKGKDLSADYSKTMAGKAIDDAQGRLAEEQIIDEEKFKELVALSNGISKLEVNIKDLAKHQYANGMRLYHRHNTELPLVFMNIDFEGGRLAVPDEMGASLDMLNILLASTGTYNPQTGRSLDKKDIENLQIELGASFGCGSGEDICGMKIATLTKNTDKTLALVNEIINNPAILETENPQIVKRVEVEFDRAKKAAIDELRLEEKLNPSIQATEEFSRAIYPKGHYFYSKSIDEQIQEIENIKLEDMREIYRKLYHANGANLTVVGNMSRQEIDSKLVPLLENWNHDYQDSERKPDYSRIAPVADPVKPNIRVVTAKDNKPEALILIGNPMDIEVDDPDYYEAVIANHILGLSGFSSRLMKTVREEKGLVYHIKSETNMLRHGSGPFMISLGCDPKNTMKATKATLATVKDFLANGITEHELELAKSSIKKGFAMKSFNSRQASCKTLAGLQLRDKDDSFINNFSERIDKITVEDVMAAAAKFIKPEKFTIVATKPKDFKMPSEDQPKVEPAAATRPVAIAA